MKGLLNFDLCFDDTLLYLCKMINNDIFIENLENITKESLNYENKNSYKINFFKNYLLNSNIWMKNKYDTDNRNGIIDEKENKRE